MRTIKWHEYCPSMPKAMTWQEVKKRQINKEDEANHAHLPVEPIPRMTYPKSHKKSAGGYNFYLMLKNALHSMLP